MSMTDGYQENTNGIIQIPKLVDSSVSSGIITLDNEFKNEKQRISKISLTLTEEVSHYTGSPSDKKSFNNLNFICDYSNMVNISYKLKSTCNQIEESIKQLSK